MQGFDLPTAACLDGDPVCTQQAQLGAPVFD
jgi:hypothetical protein